MMHADVERLYTPDDLVTDSTKLPAEIVVKVIIV